MDSLPEQHIERLAGATRDDAYSKVAQVLIHRQKGIESEDSLAFKAGFGSADAMHHQLSAWGLGGLVPPKEQPVRKTNRPEAPPQRKGRHGGGKAEELPSAAGASALFESAIARLQSDLHYTNHLHETFQDGRFEATFVYQKEGAPHPFVYLPDEVSAERWEELCAEQGVDPESSDTLYVYKDSRYLGGTSPWPTMHLVRLIAAYCLCAESPADIEALLDRLHPESREPNVAQINKYLTSNEGLLPKAKKLARVIRGETVARGLNTVGEDLFHHTAGDFVRASREQGIAGEETARVLREEYKLPDDEISRLEEIFAPCQAD